MNKSLKPEVLERQPIKQVGGIQVKALSTRPNLLAPKPDPDEFTTQILQVIGEELHARRVILWLYDEENAEIWIHLETLDGNVRQSQEIKHSDVSERLSIHELPWSPLSLSGKPELLVFENVPDCPKLGELGKKMNIKSWMSVPLTFRSRTIGFLTISNSQPKSLGEGTERLAVALAHQVTLAIEIKKLAAKHKHEAVLEERSRIAHEIHDTLAQDLSGIVIQLEAAKDGLDATAGLSKQHILSAQDLARSGLRKARLSLWALRPQALQKGNLIDALGTFAQHSSGTGIPEISFTHRGLPQPICPEVEDNLLRVANEAVNNAIRHGHPSNIEVSLKFEGSQISLEIWDDGTGFDLAQPTGEGFGLITMRERIEQIQGEWQLKSKPGFETKLFVRVPCQVK